MAKLVGPKIGVAGRVDPADLATCLVRLTELGIRVENKSELVALTFATAAQLFKAQDPNLASPTYYDDYFTTMENLGISFNSDRDMHDKFKALISDSLEEFSPEERDEVMEVILDMRKKKKSAKPVKARPSTEDILEDLTD